MILGIDVGSESKGTTRYVLLDGTSFIIPAQGEGKVKDLHNHLPAILAEHALAVAAIDTPPVHA